MKGSFDLKLAVKQMAVYCLRMVLRLFYIFPVKRNRILFCSYGGGQFSCNPKAIFNYISCSYPRQFDCVWVFQKPEAFCNVSEYPMRTVKYKSFYYHYLMLTAKVIVNNNNISSYIPLRKSQLYINTWHGGGAYKRVGVYSPQQTTSVSIRLCAEMTDYMISSSRRFSEVMVPSVMLPMEKMWEVGMPRNDVLMAPHPELVKKVKDYYHLSDNMHIVLYAPTYRGSTFDAAKEDDSLNIQQCLSALSERFGGEWIAFYRVHYFLTSSIPATEQVIDASSYPDMQELLCAADVLITDYSSSMWDMSLTGKPCFIYATDIADYQQERDFYTPINEWPFPIAQNNQELASVIQNFDEQKYAADVQHHHDALGSCETGHASQTVGDFIHSKCFADNQ